MDTFTELNYWFDSTKDIINEKTVMGIVGNKSDLFLKEEVKESDARALAREKGYEFALTSAKNATIFCEFLEKLIKKYLGEEIGEERVAAKAFLERIEVEFLVFEPRACLGNELQGEVGLRRVAQGQLSVA